jgi:EpsI family protein
VQYAKKWWPCGVFLLALILCYGPAATHLVIGWWEVTAYSHGFLIVPISFFLIFRDRTALKQLPILPRPIAGGVVLFFAAGLLMIGRVGSLMMVEQVSLLLVPPGLVLFFWGTAALRATAFPLGYLVFMLPFFDLLGTAIYWPLQTFSARMATTLLQMFGYAAYLQNPYIYLPNATLEVAKECAGLRYLVSILAIGMPLAYLTLTSWTRRLILLGSAILIAILANGFRIMLVGVIVYAGEMDYTHGPFHIFQGIFIAWIGMLALFVGSWWLSKGEKKFVASPSVESVIRPEKQVEIKGAPSVQGYALVLALFFLGAEGGLTFYKPIPVPFAETISLSQVGKWTGRSYDPFEAPFRIAGADHEQAFIYPSDQGEALHLYLGYFSFQEQGKELGGYATQSLHENATEISVGPFRVNHTILHNTLIPQQVLFWYDLDGRILAARSAVKGWTLVNGLRSRHNQGKVMILSRPIGSPDQTNRLGEEQRRFAESALLFLRQPGREKP